MAYLRHPHTHQEQRAAAASPRFVRGKRSLRNLPTNYDDKPVAARADRSWKRHRNAQWRDGIRRGSKTHGAVCVVYYPGCGRFVYFLEGRRVNRSDIEGLVR